MFSFFRKKQPPVEPTPLVVPRIKHTNFLAAIDSLPGMTESSRPVVEPLFGDLLLTYALDLGESYMAVTPASLGDYNLPQAGLRRMAEENGLQAMRGIEVRTDGTLNELTAPDNMAACSLLFPALWQQIGQDMGGPLVVAFPHRDFVLYAAADPAGVAALTQAVAQIDFDDTHALSRHLYRPGPGGWQVFSP